MLTVLQRHVFVACILAMIAPQHVQPIFHADPDFMLGEDEAEYGNAGSEG